MVYRLVIKRTMHVSYILYFEVQISFSRSIQILRPQAQYVQRSDQQPEGQKQNNEH
jgi:hypothetical protein